MSNYEQLRPLLEEASRAHTEQEFIHIFAKIRALGYRLDEPPPAPVKHVAPPPPRQLSTAEKSEAILKAILARCNAEPGKLFAFQADDWGSDTYTATLWWDDHHTHIGIPEPRSESTWGLYVSNLYDQLIHGRGLSWE